MKIKNSTWILGLAIVASGSFFGSCKKETINTKKDTVATVRKSVLELMCQNWVLKETFQNDAPQTENGSELYQFTDNGKFNFYMNKKWETLGTYWFNDIDSNSISVMFNGSTISLWMDLKELNEHALKTEFHTGGNKLNYNYTR